MDFLDHTLEDFRQYLKENTESKNTVKNYVSDLRIFLIFLDSRHNPITSENFPRFLTNTTLQEFSDYLSVINPPATLNRRVSSVKKFFDYYLEHHPLPAPNEAQSIPKSEVEPGPEVFETEPEVEPMPAPIEAPPPAPNEAESEVGEPNENLLRLLPEEITEDEPPSVEHRPSDSPASFIKTYKVQVICTLSFIFGFLITMAIYPLLYP